MAAGSQDVPARPRRFALRNAPTEEGERQASRFRLGLAVFWLAAAIAAGAWHGAIDLGWIALAAVVIGWGTFSALVLHFIGLRIYRPWVSFASVGVDLAFATVTPFALMGALDHNFTGGVLASVYFLIITLAAVRRSPLLVVLAGIAAALAHLVATGLVFAAAVPGGAHYLVHGGTVVTGINFLDQLGKSLGMVIVGWLVAHVARGLRNSERHYQELFESIPDGVLITDARGAILTANARFAQMAGVAAPLLRRMRASDLIAVAPDEPGAPLAPTALVGGPTFLTRADGGRTPVRIAATAAGVGGDTGVVMSVRDVTGQVDLERELARNRKMETVGRLAGGLAHDFNNILGGIVGAASVAAHVAARLPDPHREKLERQIGFIASGGTSAREVVRKLLDLSRASPVAADRISLARVLDEVSALCRKTIGDAVEVVVERATAEEPWVDGDERALAQALLRLCLNAGDAMPGGGRIALRVEDPPGGRALHARHPEAAPGVAYVCAAVADSGGGVAPEALDDIFVSPFTGRGSRGYPDVGLSTLYALARQHRGFIAVDSAAGAGTCIRLYLPRAAAAAEENAP